MASPLEMYSKFGLTKLDLLSQMVKISQKMASGQLISSPVESKSLCSILWASTCLVLFLQEPMDSLYTLLYQFYAFYCFISHQNICIILYMILCELNTRT